AEPVEAGGGEDDRFEGPLVELAKAAVEVPPERDDPKVGPEGPELRLPTERAGPDGGAGRKVGQSGPFPADHGVAGIFPARDGGEVERVGKPARDVLHAVDGEVDLAFHQRLFDLLHEEALAADLRQRDVQNFIAGRFDFFNFRPDPFSPKLILDPLRLPEGEAASTASDDQRFL